jgi:hypothetical protein
VRSALGVLLAAVNAALIAYFVGAGRAVEVYLVAIGLYSLMSSFAQRGQVSEVRPPSYYVLRRSRGRDEADRACAGLVSRFLSVLAASPHVGLSRRRATGLELFLKQSTMLCVWSQIGRLVHARHFGVQ